jgi:hypothetical protein
MSTLHTSVLAHLALVYILYIEAEGVQLGCRLSTPKFLEYKILEEEGQFSMYEHVIHAGPQLRASFQVLQKPSALDYV